MKVSTQPINVNLDLKCYHCHDACGKRPVYYDNKVFCCDGCKTVFGILQEHQLCEYYGIEESTGVSMKDQPLMAKYEVLNDPDVFSKLIDFTDGKVVKVRFYLPQMHCSSCIWLLEHLYRINSGINASQVNFLRKEVSISYNTDQTTLTEVAKTLARIGYPPEINMDQLVAAPVKSTPSSLTYKIVVAGFCFGNVMLFSFPEYLGIASSGEAALQQWFGYLNLALALPVFIYSASDFMVSAWQGIKQRYLNIDIPLALGILVLFVRTYWEILSGTGAGYADTMTGLVFFLLIGRWYQQKTYHNLSFERDYKSYFPLAVAIREEGKEVYKPVNKLMPGDTAIIRHGEVIPADGILKKGNASIDYSFATGESRPQNHRSGDTLYAGGRQSGEAIEMMLIKKADQSYLTQLWNEHTFHSDKKGKMAMLADQAGRIFTIMILALAVITLAYWLPRDVGTAINACTAILIVACPCTVALSIPFTLGNILRILGNQRFYLKNTGVIEHLSAITAVVFDKTGTITDTKTTIVKYEGEKLNETNKSLLKSLAWHSSHPVSRQLLDWLGEETPVFEVADFEEVTGQGISGKINGHEVRIGSPSFVHQNHLTAEAMENGTFVAIDNQISGFFTFNNPYRNGFFDIVRNINKRLKSYLLSGDNDQEKPVLVPAFGDENRLKFRQTPLDKLNFIQHLQSSGEKVLYIGDGLNDAGALQQSDVGLVVSAGNNNFIPACDAILDADRFESLLQFKQLAVTGVRIVRWSYLIAFFYNIVGLSFALTGQLSPLIAAILMPLSSVSIVLFGVIAGNIAARRLKIDHIFET